MGVSVPLPRRSAVPPYRAAERGTLGRNRGTEQRNTSGTDDLDALADRVLARVAAEQRRGTEAERTAKPLFRTPGTFRREARSPRALRSTRRAPRVGVVDMPAAPRWSDLASCLFWLGRRGWPALEVGGEAIAGEREWRAWVARASLVDLLAVRDRVADGGAPTPGEVGSAARNGDGGALA